MRTKAHKNAAHWRKKREQHRWRLLDDWTKQNLSHSSQQKFPILNPIDCAFVLVLRIFCHFRLSQLRSDGEEREEGTRKKIDDWFVCVLYWNVPREMAMPAAIGRWWWWHENDGCYANSSHLLNFNSTNAHHSYVLSNRFRSLCWVFPAPFFWLVRRSSNACNKMIWKYVDFLLLVDDTVFDWFVSKFPRFTISFVLR